MYVEFDWPESGIIFLSIDLIGCVSSLPIDYYSIISEIEWNIDISSFYLNEDDSCLKAKKRIEFTYSQWETLNRTDDAYSFHSKTVNFIDESSSIRRHSIPYVWREYTELCMGNCTFGITRRALLRRAIQHAKQLKRKMKKKKKKKCLQKRLDWRKTACTYEQLKWMPPRLFQMPAKCFFILFSTKYVQKAFMAATDTHEYKCEAIYGLNKLYVALHTHTASIGGIWSPFFCIFKKSYVHAECNKCSNVAHLAYTQTWIIIV